MLDDAGVRGYGGFLGDTHFEEETGIPTDNGVLCCRLFLADIGVEVDAGMKSLFFSGATHLEDDTLVILCLQVLDDTLLTDCFKLSSNCFSGTSTLGRICLGVLSDKHLETDI